MTATATPPRPAPTRRHRSADGPILGLLLVLFGLAWLLRESGAIAVSWQAILAGLLVVLGVGMVATAKSRGGGLVLLGVMLTVALLATSSASLVPSMRDSAFENGVGDRTYRPAELSTTTTAFSVGMGNLTVDLTDALAAAGATGVAGTTKTVAANVGFGHLVVIVPGTIAPSAVRVVSHTRWGGDVIVFGEHVVSGPGQAEHVSGATVEVARLILDLSVNAGQIEVRSSASG